VCGILEYFKGNETLLALPVGFIIVGVYWFAIRPFERRWTIRRKYAKRPDKDIEIEWEIAPDKISQRSSLGHSESSWEALVKTVRTPSGLMLYSLDQVFHYLPRRGFASDTEFEQVVELAKSKVRRFYSVT
jgi:hypothetical protein